MLIFHRPEFIMGSIKVEDIKLDDKGKPVFKETKTGSLLDASGKPLKREQCFIYWHLLPNMKGKVIKFNDEGYVKNKYPNMFFKTDKEIKEFESKKKIAADRRNKRKVEEREQELLQDLREAKNLDDEGLLQQATRNLDSFRAERKRFKR